ncbi:hypothetical protein [Mycobacterium sp. 94-17]|uniref:hypothetical protein n=1 Tax=Mycobacterium sp. 94-17 TaxID=2986147 RepID=UPI002D1EDA0C|nr:hypothetical protein [Mycobacterium sp. 94-17]MEB4208761.1 hypothetical protein [Mycobacterium sp. 94-17]
MRQYAGAEDFAATDYFAVLRPIYPLRPTCDDEFTGRVCAHAPAWGAALVGRRCFCAPGATLDTDDSTPTSERWEIKADYPDVVAQEEALLPVGKPLNGFPWCQKTKMPPNDPQDETNWIWGRRLDGVIVSVFPVITNYSTIVIRRAGDVTLYCGNS